jgi:lysyl-tRNA synthetase class 2
MAEAIHRYNPTYALNELSKPEYLKAALARFGVEVFATDGVGLLQLKLFEATTEDKLIQPTFIVAHPTDVSPLARRNDAKPAVTDRFELFIAGREIANGFSELNDPAEQAARFRRQMEDRAGGDLEAAPYDEDYVEALEYGMPPTAGEGVGIDRVTMLLTNRHSIRDVILFPLLRPVDGRR